MLTEKKKQSEKDMICGILLKHNITHIDYVNSKKIKSHLYKELAKFQPGKCEDGSVNMLSFNVGDKRMKTKTGRFLTKKLGLVKLGASQEFVQSMSDTINFALFGLQDGFKIITGSEIQDRYYEDFGGSSCMTGTRCYTGLYADNPDVYSMVCMEQGNNQARAMLIKLDDGDYLLDRIYTNCQGLIDEMWKEAHKQGWYYRINTEAGCMGIAFNGEEVYDDSKFEVSGLSYTDGEIPYQDTICWGTIRDGCLDISYKTGDFQLESTCGDLENNGYCCECCSENVHEDDAYCTDYGTYCVDCYNDNYTYCEDCSETYPNDDTTYIEGVCRSVCNGCLESNYHFCEDCNTYDTETYHIHDMDKWVCESCKDNYTECEDCNQLVSDTITVETLGSQKEVCDNCSTDYETCTNCSNLHEDTEDVEGDVYCIECVDDVKEELMTNA
jgi:hypothetical protein